MRYFNTEGRCRPEEHYMVRLDDRLEKIKNEFVDQGKYFIINRGRQYGKTTTLMALAEYLKDDYTVIAMDFQLMSAAAFANEEIFVSKFIGQVENFFSRKQELLKDIDKDVLCAFIALKTNKNVSMDVMVEGLSKLCETSKKMIVLMIDEVDSASNNQVFLDFLASLRGYYLSREDNSFFHSVILAGVYDIKNLKLKIRPEDDHKYNSPWNIAADFTIDMNFSTNQIEDMLKEYEEDKHTGMNVEAVAKYIYEYTSGYPYLVSVICKLLDEKTGILKHFDRITDVWAREGIVEAVKIIMNKALPLFQSMIRQLSEQPELKQMLHVLLFQGKRITFNIDNPVIERASMFGYIVNREGSIQVANRIFEMRLYGYFLSEEELTNTIYDVAQGSKNTYFRNGRLDMNLLLEKFVRHYTDIYGDNDEKFLETYGRKLFLLYLKPIINGTGNYYVEAQTRDAKRTDVIVDYLGEQFIVELKIWHGNEYNDRGEEQLVDYLDYYHQDKGYLLSFNFNKKKEVGVKELRIGDKAIVEAVV